MRNGKYKQKVYLKSFFEEVKMRYITESLKISAQGVPKTQLKEYQIQYNNKTGNKTGKLKKRSTLLQDNSQTR